MKTIFLTTMMAFFAFSAFVIPQSAYACATCGCAEAKTATMQTCEKCVKKPEHYHGDKPCKICVEHEKRWEMNKKMTKGHYTKTEKGDYHVMSRGLKKSPYNE